MIPTRYREKLPAELSFAISAKDASESLVGLSDHYDLSLAFIARPVWRASEFRRMLAEKLPYPVLDVVHGAKQDQHGENQWELMVYPVECGLRQTVRQLIVATGFPALLRWAEQGTDEQWARRCHRLALVFDPAGPSLSSEVYDEV